MGKKMIRMHISIKKNPMGLMFHRERALLKVMKYVYSCFF